MSATQNESPQSNRLPDGLLLAWYGDDFTGAAIVMEVLTFAGLPCALFFAVPSAAQLAKFPGVRGIGVASVARAKSPAWMERNLPQAFSALAKLCDGLVHYKVCSTLDSSPHIGSIGKAIELGAAALNIDRVPILIAAPQMRRYQCFGHLFAALGDEVFRIDRHPVMRHHPVTPMSESNVAAHLQLQSESVSFHTINLERLLKPARASTAFADSSAAQVAGFAIDCMDAKSEAAAGALIWNGRGERRFVVGSQGVEFALIRHWRETGLLAAHAPPPGVGRAERMVVVSGSASLVTAEQIAWARDSEFRCIKFNFAAAHRSTNDRNAEEARVIDQARDALRCGIDPLIYTAEGLDDIARHESITTNAQAASQAVGESLGRILVTLVHDGGVSRAIIAGGDTSGYAVQQLVERGAFALTALAPTITGAPILKLHADGQLHGLELALKGGQMGSRDYFGWVKNGGGAKQCNENVR